MTLDRISTLTPYIKALICDYACGEVAAIFVGRDDYGTQATAFIRVDGTAFIAMDNDCEGYMALHKAMAEGDLQFSGHGGVDEYVDEQNSYNASAKSIEIETTVSFW